MSDPTSPSPKKTNPLAVVIATGLVVLHTRRYRRNLLFGLTLVTLLWTFVGAAFIGGALMQRPVAFTIYWSVCFLWVLALSVMALYDLMRVRKEHSRERRKLEERLGAAMAEIKATAVDSDGDASRLETAREMDSEPRGDGFDADKGQKVQRDHDRAMGEEDQE